MSPAVALGSRFIFDPRVVSIELPDAIRRHFAPQNGFTVPIHFAFTGPLIFRLYETLLPSQTHRVHVPVRAGYVHAGLQENCRQHAVFDISRQCNNSDALRLGRGTSRKSLELLMRLLKLLISDEVLLRSNNVGVRSTIIDPTAFGTSTASISLSESPSLPAPPSLLDSSCYPLSAS